MPITATADRVPSVTLVLCIPMIGKPLTTTLLWPQETVPPEFQDFPPYGIYVHLGCAFQTLQSFTSIMSTIYIPEMNLIRAKMNNIVVLLLPAHTSNCTQPLDNGVNGVFKQTLAKTAARLINSVGEGRKHDAEEKEAENPPTADNKPFPPFRYYFGE